MHARLHRRRWVALGLALGFLMSACGTEPEAGVGVRTITTELAFGIPEEEPLPAAPAGMTDEVDESVGTVLADPPRPPPPRDDSGPAPQVEMCPTAPLDAAPAQVAPSVVEDARPAEGRYQWVVEGSDVMPGFGRIGIEGFRTRMIQDVEETDDGFRFTVVEVEVTVNTPARVETTFEVDQDEETGAGGIYIAEIHRRSAEREGTFRPAPRVLVLPLPARIGESPAGVGVHVEEEQMDTVGVDPASMESLRHTGTIVNRMHVDACGELIDSYLIEAEQEFVSATGESFTRKFDYAVATHMGGLIIFEDVARPCTTMDDERECSPEPDLVYEARIGQIDPDPLPEDDTLPEEEEDE